jgi:hypothetical protein
MDDNDDDKKLSLGCRITMRRYTLSDANFTEICRWQLPPDDDDFLVKLLLDLVATRH